MRRGSPAAARRYAKALLDVALSQGQADTVAKELQAAARVLEHKELLAALQNRAVPSSAKKGLFERLSGASSQGLAARFIGILLDKGRIADLPAVAQAYEGLWNAHRNVARADVVSAQELSAAETQALRDALKRVTASADVDVKAAVDGTLVGGLIVTVGGRTYDGSVRGRLETLRTRLRGAA